MFSEGGGEMGLFDRLLLILHSLVVAVLSAMVALAGTGAASLGWVWESVYLRWTVAGLALFLFFLSLRLLFSAMRRPRDGGVDRLTEFGYIRISLETLESIASRAARGVKGIRDLTARVHFSSDSPSSVGIGLKITVDGETPIQTLSEERQRTVKEQVEEIAGVEVSQVSVLVKDTVQPERARIRVE
jgi:uncharacterized alkaline shock family protein YloU